MESRTQNVGRVAVVYGGFHLFHQNGLVGTDRSVFLLTDNRFNAELVAQHSSQLRVSNELDRTHLRQIAGFIMPDANGNISTLPFSNTNNNSETNFDPIGFIRRQFSISPP